MKNYFMTMNLLEKKKEILLIKKKGDISATFKHEKQ